MARVKKDGKRGVGIQGKKGYLYIVESKVVIEDGIRKSKKTWIPTKLPDTPENVAKAIEQRRRLLNKVAMVPADINVSISAYVDYALDRKRRTVKDTTLSTYFYRGNRIKNYYGDIRVKEISEGLVESFLDSLFEERKLQQRTVHDTKVFFGSVMELACKEGIIASNPVKEVVINKNLAAKYAKNREADEEFFSYEEAQYFMNCAKDHDMYELFYLTLFFGLRRGEVLGLRWQAIDLKNKIMVINHTVTKGTQITRANSTKSESSKREYPLTDEQVEMFVLLKEKENTYRKLFGKSYSENDYVFKHPDGRLYYPDYPTKSFSKLMKKIPELSKGVTLHGLRTSCVSILVHQGMDVKSIQKWVGHADIDTTLRIYAKVKDKEAKKQISNTMNGLIPLKNYT